MQAELTVTATDPTQIIMAERTTHRVVRTAAAFVDAEPDRRIEQHYGGIGAAGKEGVRELLT